MNVQPVVFHWSVLVAKTQAKQLEGHCLIFRVILN